MSDGGILSKIYSITQGGKKHLTEELQRVELTNPYHIINDAKIALYCSDVLSINETLAFKENLLNQLELYRYLHHMNLFLQIPFLLLASLLLVH